MTEMRVVFGRVVESNSHYILTVADGTVAAILIPENHPCTIFNIHF